MIRSTAAWFLGKAMTSRMLSVLGQQHGEAVDAGGDAAVGRGAVLEGVAAGGRSAPRPPPSVYAEQGEDLRLDVALVDSDAAAAELLAVADQVVGCGAHVAGVGRRAGARPRRAAR